MGFLWASLGCWEKVCFTLLHPLGVPFCFPSELSHASFHDFFICTISQTPGKGSGNNKNRKADREREGTGADLTKPDTLQRKMAM